MAELIGRLERLLSLPTEVHWFCDRHEGSNKDSTHIASEGGDQEPNNTSEDAICCLEIYAYDDAQKFQDPYSRGLDKQLERCDACILGYYNLRRKFNERLKNTYGEEPVAALEKTFDRLDLDRITNALDRANQTLRSLQPDLRRKSVLSTPEKMGLFEALCNKALLTDDFLLSKHFQSPFDLVQTNKPLSIPTPLPATSIFLFAKHFDRRKWAISAWSGFQEQLSEDGFDFAVRDAMLSNMQDMQVIQDNQLSPDPSDFTRFWAGMGIIVGKLNNDLVTHSLRALEADVFMMALENLKYDTPGFVDLLQVIQKLLEIAPRDFWNALGSISPTTYVEQIFNNARFAKILEQAGDNEDTEETSVGNLLSWVKPFMASLGTAHQAQACHSICLQLLDRLQTDRFPQYARVRCFCVGLATLVWTVRNCLSSGTALTPTGRIVATEALDVVGKYVKDFLKIHARPPTEPFRQNCGAMCLEIVKISLAMECKILRSDQDLLKEGKELPQGHETYATAIWDAVVLHMDRGNIAVAKAVLLAINDLTGLEKFKINPDEKVQKEKSAFNLRLGRVTHLVCQILERINDFDPSDLDSLLQHSESATALVSSLFSSDASLFEAGINLIKTFSGESARREAIGHLLKAFFETTLNAFSWSIKRCARNRTYASCPPMLKTTTDALDVLCNPQDGLLRTRGLSSTSEVNAIEDFWKYQWEGLWVIYEMTEKWSRSKVASKEAMSEFVRDTMQYSDRLFDQYSIFANAIDSANAIKSEDGASAQSKQETAKGLLEQPTRILENIIKWLRLKDLYLAEIAVHLIQKMLDRLTEVNVVVADGPAEMLQRIVDHAADEKIYTNLTPQQKAEIARSLEANVGRPVLTIPVVDLDSPFLSDKSTEPSVTSKKKKTTTIDLEKWKSKSKRSGLSVQTSEDEFDDSDIPDSDLLSVSRSIEKMNQLKAQRKALALRAKESSKIQGKQTSHASSVLRSVQNQKDSKETFQEKRAKEQLAKKKRDAETIALLKRKAVGTGETSGVRDLGLKGKEHAPKGPSLMVSSGSESDSGDEIDHELFGTVPKIKASTSSRFYDAGRPAPERKGPVKKIRQLRSAKDMRARLAPDLTKLHKMILGWDFFHEGDFPPGSERKDYSFVTSTFKTPDEYQRVFEPLLILEAWQGLLRSREEENFKIFEIKVASRMNVDAFLELSSSMPRFEGKELGMTEADVVLVSKSPNPIKNPKEPHCLARVYKINRKSGTIIYRTNVGNPLAASMTSNSVLYGVKVESITPLEREYGALLGLKYFDLCDEITRAKPSPLLEYSKLQLGSFMKTYDVNEAQAKAVKSAIDNDAFTLIQGPPGSGKTKTIVAIVGALLTNTLTARAQGTSIAIPANVSRQPSAVSPVAVKKLLVCAPSNAAVDELVLRFKQGVKTTNGVHKQLKVVRLGRSDAINNNVLDVTLEELVNAKLYAGGKSKDTGEEFRQNLKLHKEACNDFNALRNETDALKAEGKPLASTQIRDLDLLKRRKAALSSKIDQARDKKETDIRDAEIKRRLVQQEILHDAHVICATLSGSGNEMFQSLDIEFETVIIDEAAQSIELSALIPLKYGCAKCILVGDPKQLPPTVLSREAARFQYEQSIFVRMQANHPNDVHLLDIQYRMHPEISHFPSKAFYDGKLVDGPDMAGIRKRPWHQSDLLGPYRFFDVYGQQKSAPRGHSLINNAEIEVALKLYERVVSDCKGYDFRAKVGIITPYKSQLRELRLRFARKYGDDIFTSIEFNTTDAFQGRESEIIIFSCVRASVNRGIGFLSDIRRMNVGITRAKCSLWVLGNSQSLMKGEFWGRMIEDAKSRNRFTGGDLAEMLSKPLIDPQNLMTSTAGDVWDVEMRDVDEENEWSGTPQKRRSSASSASSSGIPANPRWGPKTPSGGFNGLNPEHNCHRCGSSRHLSYQCDNEEALRANGYICKRCGKPGCNLYYCQEHKCTRCGQTGHVMESCTSKTPLPRQNQERLRIGENERAQRIAGNETAWSRAQGRPASSQQGPKIPATHISTEPKREALKRRRSSASPPAGAPKRPNLLTNVIDPSQQALLRSREPTLAHSHQNPSKQSDKKPIAETKTKAANVPPQPPAAQPPVTVQNLPGISNGRPPTLAQLHLMLNKEDGEEAKPEAKKKVGNPNANVKPPKRKKEVDLFIRPKKRPR